MVRGQERELSGLGRAHEPDRAPSPGRDRRGQRVRESLQENLADHARSTLHLPRVLPYPPSHHNAPQTGSLTQPIRSGAPAHPRDRHRRCSGMDRCLPGVVHALEGLPGGENTQAGNTPTNVSFERVTASTSSSPRGSCSPTWTPPGTTRCPQQPTRSKARTLAYARCCATTAACA